LVRACESGRDELYQLAEVAERGFAYARFSGEELRAAGFEQVDRVPFLIDWAKFDAEPDPSLLAELGDGCFNLLFVGRVVPNKRLEDVIRAFTAFQRFYHPRSRLVVAGALDAHSPYVAGLRALAAQLRPERVRWLGRVTQAQLSACYATASVYLSMSQHEGFGVPLVEAMHRGVPVVAYGAAAVPETMGGAGITTLSSDPMEVAKLLAVVDRDRSVRERLVARERARATDFEPDRTLPRLKEALAPFLGRPSPRLERPSRPEVLIVAPGLEARPEEPLSRAARSLARALGARADVELLTLKADGWPAEMGPEVTREGRVTVSRFSPELPLEPAEEALPRSSSLQSRVRAFKGPVVFFGGRQAVALAVLPRVGERAFVVDVAGIDPPPEAKALGARRHAASAEGLDDAVQAVAAQVRARLEQGGSRGA
ncbi:MAG TPA: glycosyltransferase, partial [Myxococcaceae bacterium]|nr:glycosyltransferase [Myxococcaceae bacterium]